MGHKSSSFVWLLFCLPGVTLLHAQDRTAPKRDTACNQDRTVCVRTAVERSVIQNPLYFEVQMTCPDNIALGWELRDGSGQLLAQDPDGDLAFLLTGSSASRRTVAVRDFGLAPARSSHGTLILHPVALAQGSENRALPELSIPVQLDLRTTTVTYAVPANPNAFAKAVDDTVESEHSAPLQAEVQWRTRTILYTPPAMLGAAAAEAAALADPGQGPWHVIDYKQAQETAHITVFGSGWAGVTYYLTGLDYLIEKTAEHQPGIQRVVFDQPPDPGQ